MNPTPETRRKVLNVYLEKNSKKIPQGIIRIYKNGSIKVSEVKLKPSFLEQVHAPTQMMDPSAEYIGFSLNKYMETLEKGFNNGLHYSIGQVRVREKQVRPQGYKNY